MWRRTHPGLTARTQATNPVLGLPTRDRGGSPLNLKIAAAHIVGREARLGADSAKVAEC